jgi:enamine deaminase RidA (YjgF/YER057c/UK114 family)
MTANLTDTLIDARLKALGLALPPAPAAIANYVPFVLDGHHLYVSGQVSRLADGTLIAGQLGLGLAMADGQAAAKACALNILAQAKAALGSLARIERIVRLTGFVNAAAGFADHPAVVNGASDLMVAVLGDAGRHTRAAVGCSGLPANAAVEVDAIILVK